MECIDLKDIKSVWKYCGLYFPQNISHVSSCVMDDWAWFSGGWDALNLTGDLTVTHVYRWKPEKGWERKTDMLHERVGHAMTSDGKLIYVIGGFGAWKNVESFDPKDNRWHVLSELPAPLENIGAVYFPWGQILVPGGYGLQPGNAYSDQYTARHIIYMYDIMEDSWSISNVKLNQAVHSAGIAIIG